MESIVEKIDPMRLINIILTKEDNVKIKEGLFKDLTKITQNLNKIIILDN